MQAKLLVEKDQGCVEERSLESFDDVVAAMALGVGHEVWDEDTLTIEDDVRILVSMEPKEGRDPNLLVVDRIILHIRGTEAELARLATSIEELGVEKIRVAISRYKARIARLMPRTLA